MNRKFTLFLAAAAALAATAQDAPKLSYTHPAGALYFGVSQQHTQLHMSIVVGPVFSPVTWHNTSPEIPGATVEWYFQGNDNSFITLTNSPEQLTYSYKTDYSSELAKHNNLFYTPELQVTLNGERTDYTRGKFYQAGGYASYTRVDATYNYGMTVFDLDEAPNGLDIIVGDNDEPVFGYNSGVDTYWGKKEFGADYTESNTEYARVSAIMNLQTAPEAPIVINGAWILAKGHDIPNGAQFTFQIVGLDNLDDLSAGTVLASKKITGEEVISRASTSGTERNLCLPFTFDEPLVIDNTVCRYYMARLCDYRSRTIPYFAPLMSTVSNPDGLNLGYFDLQVAKDGETTTERRTVDSAVGRKLAFAIMLNAEWPWLYSEVNKVNITNDQPAEVSVDSYYELADLKVEDAPSWLKVEMSGRLGSVDPANDYQIRPDGKIKFSCEGVEGTQTANVTITGPGVSHTFEVVATGESGIESVAAKAAEVSALFTASGRRVSATTPLAPGIYLRQMTDGTVTKFVVK